MQSFVCQAGGLITFSLPVSRRVFSPLVLGAGWNVQRADVFVVVFHVTFDFQGLVLVDVLPHFCNNGTSEPFY